MLQKTNNNRNKFKSNRTFNMINTSSLVKLIVFLLPKYHRMNNTQHMEVMNSY